MLFILILLGWFSCGIFALGLVFGESKTIYDSHKWEREDFVIIPVIVGAGLFSIPVILVMCYPYYWSLRPFTPITIGQLMLEKLEKIS